jgi:hypothetical protein
VSLGVTWQAALKENPMALDKDALSGGTARRRPAGEGATDDRQPSSALHWARMPHAWVNPALLALVAAQLASGLAGLLGSTEAYRLAFWAHAVGGYAIITLLGVKAAVVRSAVRRRRGMPPGRHALVLLALLLLAVLGTALAWIVAGRWSLGGVSGINLHAYLAFVLAAVLAWHALDRRWVVRVPGAMDRRAFLRAGAAAVAGLALWQVERTAQALLDTPGSRRRFTGSFETGSGTGRFPVTSWLNDDPDPIDPASWRLRVDGMVARPLALAARELRARAREDATLDCTGGWYTEQRWGGVRLGALLDAAAVLPGASSVVVRSVTGYARRFDLDHARRLLVATEVAGRPLTHGHGAPARLVVPGRRGFEWVKWIVRVEVIRGSHLWQPPLPLD